MLKPINMIRPDFDGDEQRDRTRLSHERLDELIQKHLTHISDAQHRLQLACTPFSGKGNVRPIQCKEAIASLDNLYTYVQDFSELLNEISHLPVVYTALRYRLLFRLRLIEEKTSRLISLIDTYSAFCMASSQHVRQQSKTIYDSYEVLSKLINRISQETKLVDDEARFQEQNLVSRVEEKHSSELAVRDNTSFLNCFMDNKESFFECLVSAGQERD